MVAPLVGFIDLIELTLLTALTAFLLLTLLSPVVLSGGDEFSQGCSEGDS